MVLIIYGFPASTCTRTVAAVCKEIGLEYKLVLVPFPEVKSAENLARNPFGQVPTIDDDGFELFESRAICKYLAAKYGKHTTLIPTSQDLQEWAIFESAVNFEQHQFDEYARNIAIEKLFTPYVPQQPNEERLTKLFATLESKLEAYDKILSKRKWLAGENITLADLFHLPFAYMLETKVGSDVLQKRPNVARWWNELVGRPSWQAVKDGA
ncbi:glutathione S-transferase [Exidia glandulosa HHB12029]|uniref:glutathione transferase n=1 Tax=Exidia glandulosa HHB12029 TaxID=1314781 RepID=A0A165FPL0_EXIGL|nr:glutathione S-transferase [Exidia glandulosa HHB12029]